MVIHFGRFPIPLRFKWGHLSRATNDTPSRYLKSSKMRLSLHVQVIIGARLKEHLPLECYWLYLCSNPCLHSYCCYHRVPDVVPCGLLPVFVDEGHLPGISNWNLYLICDSKLFSFLCQSLKIRWIVPVLFLPYRMCFMSIFDSIWIYQMFLQIK